MRAGMKERTKAVGEICDLTDRVLHELMDTMSVTAGNHEFVILDSLVEAYKQLRNAMDVNERIMQTAMDVERNNANKA